ncbi:MAG TPA: hypothetical protein VFH61_05965 [Thermoleophilia bacterium]|nr:hypothetical protein [Thermoleophilia bacterium]
MPDTTANELPMGLYDHIREASNEATIRAAQRGSWEAAMMLREPYLTAAAWTRLCVVMRRVIAERTRRPCVIVQDVWRFAIPRDVADAVVLLQREKKA